MIESASRSQPRRRLLSLLGAVALVVTLAAAGPASGAEGDWAASSIPNSATLGYPTASILYAGEVHVFAPELSGNGIRHFAAGSQWASETIDPGGSSGQDVAVAVWYGQLHVFSRPSTGTGIRHAVWDGRQWLTHTIDAGGTDTTGLAVLAGYYGEFHVFARGVGGTGLRHLVYAAGGSWIGQDLDAQAAGQRTALGVLAGELHAYTAASGDGVRHLVYAPSQRRWFAETIDPGGSDARNGIGLVHWFGEVHLFTGRKGAPGMRQLVYAGGWITGDLDTGASGSTGTDVAAVLYAGGIHVMSRSGGGTGLRHTWFGLVRGWQSQTIDASGTSGRGTSLLVRGSAIDAFSAGNGGGLRRNTFDSAVAIWGGIGAWVDRYDYPSSDPGGLDVMASHGVATLYLQTGRSSEAVDVLEPGRLGTVLEGAHDRGMKVVAWYAPSFVDPDLDVRRSLAAVNFVSPRGDRFDGFAPDIESSKLADAEERSRRLTAYSRVLRAATLGTPLGAIVPSPLGFVNIPDYWPGFPWWAIGENYDAVLPMLYWSYKGTGPQWSSGYVGDAYVQLYNDMGSTQLPVHGIGGIANEVPVSDVTNFAATSCRSGVIGVSLYDAGTTSQAQWDTLTATFHAQCW
ncbi:MAG: hypothetical protein K1X95_09575 [Acidimicrobiia bacterium]|nr:hypothetical protein [Acidimicrobiia bacterium]